MHIYSKNLHTVYMKRALILVAISLSLCVIYAAGFAGARTGADSPAANIAEPNANIDNIENGDDIERTTPFDETTPFDGEWSERGFFIKIPSPPLGRHLRH